MPYPSVTLGVPIAHQPVLCGGSWAKAGCYWNLFGQSVYHSLAALPLEVE